MTQGKRGRLKLDTKSYRELCARILRRDSWRCQACGSTQNLHIHHHQARSQGGDDSEQNLRTLCSSCHRQAHRLQP